MLHLLCECSRCYAHKTFLRRNPISDLKEQLLAEITTETGLSLKEQNFLDVLFEGCQGDIRMAMTESGFGKDVPVAYMARKFAKEIKELAKDYLTASSARAAVKLVSVIEDPNQIGAKNVIAATNSVLDRAGVFKEEATKVSEIRNVFILPAKQLEAAIDSLNAKEIENSGMIIDHED